ncbi:MAG: hypothetical protein H0V80_13710 [Acidobacteria bacterium]|nr:hypothetical protein [Acidobacteriota bacterium]
MLLLDTHVLLWWLQDSRKLRAQARRGDCASRNLLVTQARLEHLRLVTGDAGAILRPSRLVLFSDFCSLMPVGSIPDVIALAADAPP